METEEQKSLSEQQHIDEEWFGELREAWDVKAQGLGIGSIQARAREEMFLEANGVKVKPKNDTEKARVAVEFWKERLNYLSSEIAESPSAGYYDLVDPFFILPALKEKYSKNLSSSEEESLKELKGSERNKKLQEIVINKIESDYLNKLDESEKASLKKLKGRKRDEKLEKIIKERIKADYLETLDRADRESFDELENKDEKLEEMVKDKIKELYFETFNDSEKKDLEKLEGQEKDWKFEDIIRNKLKSNYLKKLSESRKDLIALRGKIKLEIKELRADELKELEALKKKGLNKADLKVNRRAIRKDPKYKEIREKRAAAILHRQTIREDILKARCDYAEVEGDMEKFNKLNRKIYPDVNPKIFEYTLRQLYLHIAQFYNPKEPSDDPSPAEKAAKELYDILPKIDLKEGRKKAVLSPKRSTFGRVKRDVERNMAFFETLEGIKDSEKFNAEQIQKISEEALKFLDAEKYGWKVATDPKLRASTTIRNKVVLIPEKKEEDKLDLKKLIAHEINTHAGRSINGNESRLALLGSGLRNYINDEEGVATQAEQSLDEKFDKFSGEQYYLAGGLIAGLDGTKRNFRDMFHLMRKYYAFKMAVGAHDEDEEESKKARTSEDKAYSTCKRMFRETTGVLPGVFSRKDLSYRAGNIGVWKLLDKDLRRLATFKVGKWKVTSKTQLVLLCELGIVELGIQHKHINNFYKKRNFKNANNNSKI